MKKLRYFFAAVYQNIKNRRPDGTPYLNLCMGITGILLLHIVHFLLVLKIWFHTNLMSRSNDTFMVWFLSLSILIGVLIRVIIPLDEIKEIGVSKRDRGVMGFFFISYFMLCIGLMGVLLILSRPTV